MGDYLSTTITSPQVVAEGGVLSGTLTVKSPSAGNFYLLVEQYTSALVFIPGSRAYLHMVGAWPGAGFFVNDTTLYTSWHFAATGVEVELFPVTLTLPNSDCLLYVFLKHRASNVVAGAFVVGTTYEIMVVGTTDFTLIGAAANTVGLTFTATGVGEGTGLAAELPDPDTDDHADYVVITIQSVAPSTGIGIDLGEIMNLMITMMIVGMMMKMMTGMAKP